MAWRVEISDTAKRQLKKLGKKAQKEILVLVLRVGHRSKVYGGH